MAKTLVFLMIFVSVISYGSSSKAFYGFGNATVNGTALTLTQQYDCFSEMRSVNGQVFFHKPVNFYDRITNSTVSFYSKFTFSITPPRGGCAAGEGLAFVISSELNFYTQSIGLPYKAEQFFAVEFDSSFDLFEGDKNDNHVGVDFNSVISISSVDLKKGGIDLKSGRSITAWIEYRNSQRVVLIWVSHLGIKPEHPILVTPIDLSTKLDALLFVGFTASNVKGSSMHQITNWLFKIVSDEIDSFESVNRGTCSICYPEDTSEEDAMQLSISLKIIHTEISKIPDLIQRATIREVKNRKNDLEEGFWKMVKDTLVKSGSSLWNKFYELFEINPNPNPNPDPNPNPNQSL